ncbi:uncharacterized protein J8A68_005787 [[Candida] subhashii]|uniref:Cytidyltransferase-like domain-containing protein n=1 Tax=[Candida] subhashii TaxID=561895 RepID=A0A8J5QLE4_9ASCO|nr:uncharacterized protein J8A68_005787 [[Candida] subhashii]KAG7660670.1 hypothetical protein J8A68_005787 [[Candida] subhashii]
MTSRFVKPIQEFIKSQKDFNIIYNTSHEFLTPTTQRVCVLDSSFNPPHLGHYALVEESLKKSIDHKSKVVLLLLSIKNADKVAPDPISLSNRLEMMYIMANDISNRYTVNVSIGLTKHAKFVDKSISILNYIDNRKDVKLTFLIGFDTLIRILNPKYYLPDKLSTSLEQFMKSTDLFCLTRTNKEITNDQQSRYLEEIKKGRHEDIPSHWTDNIYMVENFGDDVANYSSSDIRLKIASNDENWKPKVVSEIRDFIINQKLYKKD